MIKIIQSVPPGTIDVEAAGEVVKAFGCLMPAESRYEMNEAKDWLVGSVEDDD